MEGGVLLRGGREAVPPSGYDGGTEKMDILEGRNYSVGYIQGWRHLWVVLKK